MATGGEAHDADARRIDIEVLRSCANEANSALRVPERNGKQVFRAEAIGKDEGGDAASVKPVGGLASFEIVSEVNVCAARTDDHRRTVGGMRLRVEDGQRGNINGFRSLRARRCTIPETNDLDIELVFESSEVGRGVLGENRGCRKNKEHKSDSTQKMGHGAPHQKV